MNIFLNNILKSRYKIKILNIYSEETQDFSSKNNQIRIYFFFKFKFKLHFTENCRCNICDLILENNIELTSHICSHLESNELSTDQNIYISPFDAVTTTCGVCDTQFNNPFQLIKHLDSAHMKQLSEYKCRICEKQHEKLSDLIEHLNKLHSEQEMPYRCDACGFRTSFYADAIYHIKKEHLNTLRHFCPYCLKSLVLPFNKKLGHVQCNIFYSHLITHFNKHENDQIIPSKCKHCTKCILHIRHMKEHLVFDHNSIIISEEKSSDDEKKEDYDDKIELDLVNAEKDLRKRLSNKTSRAIDPESKSNAQINLRKRKRSLNEARNESENEASEDDLVKLDELESEVKLDDPLKDKLKAEGRVKTKKKTSEYSNLIKKAQTLKSSKNESVEVKTDDLKEEPNSPVVEEPVVYKKKQKALKQTNVRPNMQRRRFRSSNFVLDRDLCQVDSSNSQHLSALIYGSLRFSCEKAQFKCIECGDTDLKSHYSLIKYTYLKKIFLSILRLSLKYGPGSKKFEPWESSLEVCIGLRLARVKY
ncbi:Pogo transposable element with ZNF domain [Brachionus plicatilis]|uniref:Pogo transposable element with ZNF domain n=1 Tax=Brachionus plicatilis TaxID=10195 RepID=A0A3M7RCH1_BRAPC|nr:Pogo transposable element with ZNF domain [Brachionus plicatilis]